MSLALAAFSVVALVGNRALADGESALNDGRVTLAANRAQVALRWTPWSAQAHRLLAEAQSATGDLDSVWRESAGGGRFRSTRLDSMVRARPDHLGPGRRAGPRRGQTAQSAEPRDPVVPRGPDRDPVIGRRLDLLADPEPLIRRVYAYVAFRLGDMPEAEDVTSDVFERAVGYRPSYDPARGEPIAWLIGIARHAIDDSRARSVPRPSEALHAALAEYLEEEVIRRTSARLRDRTTRRAGPRAHHPSIRSRPLGRTDRDPPGSTDECGRSRAPSRARSSPFYARGGRRCKERGSEPVVGVEAVQPGEGRTMRFRRRDSGENLEAELLASRSQPSETFVKALGAQVNATTRRSRRNTYARVSFACAISVVMFGVLASFGGIGYAASSTVDVVEAAKSVSAPAKKQPARVVKDSPGQDQYAKEKVTTGHRTGSGSVTITISRSALPAHLAHGDTIGPCP